MAHRLGNRRNRLAWMEAVLHKLGIDTVGRLFMSLALFAYSFHFTAPYPIPKLLVLSAGLLVMAIMVLGGAPVNRGRSLWADGGLFLGVAVLSAIFADDKWLAVAGNHNSYALGLVGLTVAFCYHIAVSGGTSLWPLPLAGALMGVHALAQLAGIDDKLSSILTGNRAIGTMGSPVFLGMALAALLPVAISESWIFGLAVGLGIVATKSKGAMLAAMVGLLALGISRKSRAALYAAVLMAVVFIPALLTRPATNSDTERVAVWKSAILASLERPILGVGPDGFANAYRRHQTLEAGKDVAEDAHNDLLQILVTMGVIGLCAYASLFFVAMTLTTSTGLGSVLALFTNAKFNPIPLEILVLGAVIFGAALKGLPDNRPLNFLARLPILAASLLVCAFSWTVAKADNLVGRGDFLSIQKACSTNPYELTYKALFLNLGVQEFNKSVDPELKQLIIKSMREEIGSAVIHRPKAEFTDRIVKFGEGLKWL